VGTGRPAAPHASGYVQPEIGTYMPAVSCGLNQPEPASIVFAGFAGSVNVGTGIVGAPACGDVMKLQIKVDENGKIIDAKFKTFGCGSAIASSSLATEWIKGQSADYASTIKNDQIAKELSLPPVKLHCSMLAQDAIQAALKDYQKKQANKGAAAK